MSRHLAVIFLCVVCANLYPSLTHAEPLTSSQVKQRHTLMTQANEAWAQGDYDTALSLYTRAQAIQDHPDIVYRIAQVNEKLGYSKIAARGYKTYLVQVPDSPYSEQIQAHAVSLEEKGDREDITVLTVRTDPPGATIIMDGEVAMSVSPAVLVGKSPGEHRIVLRLEGYLEEEHTISLQRGESREERYELTPEVEPESISDVEPEEETPAEDAKQELGPPSRTPANVPVNQVDISTPLPWKIVGHTLMIPGTLLLVVGLAGLSSDGLVWIDVWGPMILGGAIGVGASSYILFIRDWKPRVSTPSSTMLGVQPGGRSERPSVMTLPSSRGLQLKFRF